MEDGKRLLEKLTKGKKPGKNQCLIFILAGILLCVIMWPVKSPETKSDLSNMLDDTIGIKESVSQQTADSWMVENETGSDYVSYWEDKLENILCCVEGAGKVKVMITLKESEKDGPEEMSDVVESDATGGQRATGESRIEKTTIYTTDENGNSVPYVIKTIPPMVEGVVVIAQGADANEAKMICEQVLSQVQIVVS